jgi:hypothetical protein
VAGGENEPIAIRAAVVAAHGVEPQARHEVSQREPLPGVPLAPAAAHLEHGPPDAQSALLE